MTEERRSTAELLKDTRTYGQVRCHNPSCIARITPTPGASTVKCPQCGSEWRIFWVKPGFPRIRGPVWDTNLKLAQEIMTKITEKSKEKTENGLK